MSNLEIKAVELIAAQKNGASKESLDTFIFEPENIEEQNLGSLYIIGEITETSPNSEYLINLLVATIKKEYYSNTSKSPITGLESTLNKTNETLADFAEKGNIDWIGNMNIIIAVLKDGTLYFSQTGRAKALLVRGNNVINIGQELVSDLKPHPLKTFSNIANGQIDAADRLIFATSRLLENIEEKEIGDIFSETPDNAIEEFESRLKGSGTALVFIKAEEKTNVSSAVSIRKILASEQNTKIDQEETKSKDVWEYSKKHPSQKNRLDEIIGELNDAERESELSQKVKFIAKVIRFIVRNTKKILYAFFIWSKKTAIATYNILKPKIIAGIHETRELFSSAFKRTGSRFSRQESSNKEFTGEESGSGEAEALAHSSIDLRSKPSVKINNIETVLSAFIPKQARFMPANRKIAVTGIAILVIVTSATAYGWFNTNKENEKRSSYAIVLDSAKKAEIAAESSLIYENKQEAGNLIRETLAGTEKLISAGYFIDEAKELQKKAIEQMDKIENVTRIADPVKLVDFAENSQSIKTNGIVWSGKNLYAFNSSNNALYKYDFAQKSSQIVAVNSENMGHLKIAKPFGAKIIFLTDSPGTAVYDPAKSELKNVSIKLNQAETDISDIDTFGSNLYVLAKNEANIYKHILTTGGYAKGEKWILNGAEKEIQNPVSVSIDGDVYVLQNTDSSSKILKFSKGIKKDFALPALLIPLKNAVKIFALGNKYLYILDPENKRVVMIAKDGKTFKQITSDKFDNLIDFTINPNEKSIYLLNGTTAYEVGL